MFSMFFGAGNITFPLVIGQAVGKELPWALLGLILTAVVVPFSGLFAMTLFKGDYERFFYRMGKWPGFAVIVFLLSLIGPLGGIPRCLTLTFSMLKTYVPTLSLIPFSLASAGVIFLCAWKRNRILDLVGYVLSPLLIFFLLAIVIKGVFFSSSGPSIASTEPFPFLYGLKEGYNTMDLLGAFFFSSLIYSRVSKQQKEKERKGLFVLIFKSSLIGALLLTLIYIGFSYVAAHHQVALEGVGVDQILGKIGQVVLGHHAGLIICLSIALTCLTTAIALAIIVAEFLEKKILKGRISYNNALVIVLLISTFVSTLEFTGIVRLLSPVLQLIYPSLLILSVFNICYKTFGYRPVKIPVFMSFMVFALCQHLMK